jgi:uncharacterized damage-inducible protein DinB
MSNQPDLRYPVGKFNRPTAALTTAERGAFIDTIAQAPANIRSAIKGLSEKQLDTPYRPEGWTVRQVVHHVADSHLNAYCRFKLGLTEDVPTVKPYNEAKWAELIDGRRAPVSESLTLLEALHSRWDMMLRDMKPAEFRRNLSHPEWDTPPSLDDMLAMYAWHGRHHCGHITALRERGGW